MDIETKKSGVRSPLSWVGGKFYLAKRLIELFPPHTTYVEVFGGAAHVLFRKEPSKIEVYNDIDDRLVNFFNVVHDEEKCAKLREMVDNTLYARSVFNKAKQFNGESDVEKAYDFFVVNKMSFANKMGTWVVEIACDRSKIAKEWFNRPLKIDAAFWRIKQVQLENSNFEYILKRYDRPTTFFYCDPPYPFTGERGCDKLYKHEMTNTDHERLVDILLNIKGKAMLSGYDTPIYDKLLENGWHKVPVGKSAIRCNLKTNGEKRQTKNEFVWINYEI